MTKGRSLAFVSAAVFVASTALAWVGARDADAQSFIRQPNNHVSHVEVEVHGIVGWDFWYGGNLGGWAFGPGFRVGIPVMQNGFVRSINNLPAINFGADLAIWLYPNNRYPALVGLVAPVMLQWNFYVHPRWSIAAELGLAASFFFYDQYCLNRCWLPFGYIWPGAAFTARYHFREGAGFPALTMRLGFPTGFNIGVSF